MKLREYLETQTLPKPAFAAEIGVSVQSLYRYIAADRLPHREVMARIEKATGGAVGPADFYASPTPPAAFAPAAPERV